MQKACQRKRLIGFRSSLLVPRRTEDKAADSLHSGTAADCTAAADDEQHCWQQQRLQNRHSSSLLLCFGMSVLRQQHSSSVRTYERTVAAAETPAESTAGALHRSAVGLLLLLLLCLLLSTSSHQQQQSGTAVEALLSADSTEAGSLSAVG